MGKFHTQVKVRLPTAADRHNQTMYGYDLRIHNKPMPHHANPFVRRGWEMADAEIRRGEARTWGHR